MTQPYAARLVIRRPEAAPVAAAGSSASPTPFEARWMEWDGQVSEPQLLTPPLSQDDTNDLRWYLEEFPTFVGAGTRARARNVESRLEGWGRSLFETLFGTAAGRDVYRNMMGAARDGRPVFLTLGTTEADVLVQPWEMMRDAKGPLTFRGVSIRRQLEGMKTYQRLELPLPLRVLLIVSRPTDSGFLDPRTSVRPLLDGLDLLPKGSVEVDFCEPPTLSELSRRISKARKAKRPFHIVHFDGHGTYMPETGVGALCFEKPDRATDLVPGLRLGDLMARLEVPLVMLEACRTADLSDKPVFGSVAPALLQSGVGSVVAFSHAVHVEAAKQLVESFYRDLAEGLSVGSALGEARVQLRSAPERWLRPGPNPPTVELQDWFVPQLYQVGPDLSLVADEGDLSEGDEDGLAPILETGWKGRLHGFPPEPRYRFHGRALELLELGRAFHRHWALVVSGGGGMGKTSLAREAAAWWLRTGRFEEAVFCSFEQVRSVEQAVQALGQALEGLEFARRPGD
ncbi:MAG: CHAT domain-containing protein, partial [Holophagales bacterium]|nr:CHAT domain-containing protein [Holophagales bacterium]